MRHIKIGLILAAAAVFTTLLTAAVHADGGSSERQSIINLFKTVTPAVGALYAQEEKGDMIFLCSATAVARQDGQTVVLTAHHCLRKGVAYLINFGDNRYRALTVWKIPHYEVDATKYPRRYNEPKTDMALFLLDGEDVPIIDMAPQETITAGMKIAMVGFPLGVAKITYEGIVAGKFDRPGSDLSGYTLLQVFGAPGSSGSAVLSVASGKVLGVMVAVTASQVGLPVIFATPVDYLQHLTPIQPLEKSPT